MEADDNIFDLIDSMPEDVQNYYPKECPVCGCSSSMVSVDNAVYAFDSFFDYLNESGNYRTDTDDRGHYIEVFKQLLKQK